MQDISVTLSYKHHLLLALCTMLSDFYSFRLPVCGYVSATPAVLVGLASGQQSQATPVAPVATRSRQQV